MAVDGRTVDVGNEPEYGASIAASPRLLKARQSDADFTPFTHVADALARSCVRVTVRPLFLRALCIALGRYRAVVLWALSRR